MKSLNEKNLLIFTTVSSVWAVVFGFIGPFYVVHVEKLSGGMEKLGIAFGIMVFLQSMSTYIAGHFSDKLGRKTVLVVTAYTDALILILYTIIKQTYQLYVLQALLGITNGIVDTISTTLLGDLTIKEKRGKAIGKFNAIVSFSSAIGLSIGGYLVKIYGLNFLFYFASIIVIFSTSLLFFLKEKTI